MSPYWIIGDGDGLVSSAVCQHKQHWRPAGGWCELDREQEYLQLSQMKRWSQVSICLLIERILSQEIMFKLLFISSGRYLRVLTNQHIEVGYRADRTFKILSHQLQMGKTRCTMFSLKGRYY